MKNAVVFLADGFEEIEAVTVIDYLRRAEINVSTVAVNSKNEECGNECKGSHGIIIKADFELSDFFDKKKYFIPDLVYIPGGMPGAENIGSCAEVIDFIKKCFSLEKYIAAICAAPVVVLAKTGILRGKNWTCYPGMEKQLDKYCSSCEKDILESTLETEKPFVVCGNVITGRGPGAAEQFAMELVKLLVGEKIAIDVKRKSIQR